MKQLDVQDEVLGLVIREPLLIPYGHLEVQLTTDLTRFKF